MMDHGQNHGDHGGSGHAGHGDQPALHGMLIVGEEEVFLSHFPMFDHVEHAYQVVLKVRFTGPEGDPQAAYVEDRRAHPETRMYTLSPEDFVLADIAAPDAGSAPQQSFKATIFRGHFERGGVPILRDVEVEVADVVHFRRFEPLTYLLFGTPEELFLVHVITRPPDFDQVLAVEVASHEFTSEQLRHGVRVVVPERANALGQRLRPVEQIVGRVQVGGDGAAQTLKVQLETGVEFYFEEGELRSPAVFRPTAEEQAAGF